MGLVGLFDEPVFNPVPCDRCGNPCSQRTATSGWTCDWPGHEGVNHFSGGIIYGCADCERCNWWMCPACWPKAQAHYNPSTTKASAGRREESAKAPGAVTKIKPAEALFSMVQAVNFFFTKAIPMVNLHNAEPLPGTLTHTLSRHRGLILSIIKNEFFNNVLQSTQGTGGQFELFLSRSKARKHAAMGKPDTEGSWSVFAQAFRVIHPMDPKSLRRTDRLYITKLMGEHAQDAGGPYRESFDTYAQELQSSALSLFVRTPNGCGAVGFNREKWVFNPSATSQTELEMLAFLGKLMGIAIRSKEYLALNIPSIIWYETPAFVMIVLCMFV